MRERSLVPSPPRLPFLALGGLSFSICKVGSHSLSRSNRLKADTDPNCPHGSVLAVPSLSASSAHRHYYFPNTNVVT